MDECLFEADLQKELGNAAYRNKDFNRALLHYKKAAARNPNNMIYKNNIGAVHFEQGDYMQCIKECQSAVSIGRSTGADIKHIAKSLCRIAHSYHKLNDLNSALHYYRLSLKEVYNDDILKKIQELELVLHKHINTLTTDPCVSLQFKNMGDASFQNGNFPEALTYYTKAINSNPKDPDLFSLRADSYAKLLEFKAAAADCDSCLAIDPNHVKAYLRKGNCLLALREYARAEAAYITALEIKPDSKEAMDGFKRCLKASQMGPEIIKKEAMRDPEVKKILQDPNMRRLLDDVQMNPQVMNSMLKSPDFAQKIEKLIEYGLLAIR